MALAFDAASAVENQSAGTTATLSHTTSGSNRILIVACHQTSVGANSVTGVTYNGVSMTKIGATVTIQASNAYMTLWYLVAPATGANNIVVTKGSGDNTSVAAVSYTGAKQTGQPEVNGTDTGSGTAPTRAMTPSTNNAMLLMAVGGDGTGGTATESTNWTRRANNYTKGSIGEKLVATPASTTQTVTFNASQNWGVIQISLAENVSVDVTVSATTPSATFSTPSRTVTGGATVSPSALSATFSLPSSTVTAIRNVSIASTVLSATFTIPTYTSTAIQNVSVASSVLSASFTLPSRTVIGGANISVSPSALSATFSIPASAITGGVTASPSALSATFSLPSATVSATRSVTVSSSALVATFTIPSYTVSAQTSETVSPSTLSATFSIPAPTITTTRTVSVSASVLSATFTIPTYIPTGTSDIVVTASVLSATFSIPSITVGLGSTISPSVLSATFSLPTYTVDTIRSVVVEPQPVTMTISLPTLGVVADFWQTKYPQVSIGDGAWTNKY